MIRNIRKIIYEEVLEYIIRKIYFKQDDAQKIESKIESY